MHINQRIFTTRIRRMGIGTVFSLFVSPHLGGGVPQSGLGGGEGWGVGRGYPIPGLEGCTWVTPPARSGWGTPSPQPGLDGVPPRPGTGYPLTWDGIPPWTWDRVPPWTWDGVPPRPGTGYPPTWEGVPPQTWDRVPPRPGMGYPLTWHGVPPRRGT